MTIALDLLTLGVLGVLLVLWGCALARGGAKLGQRLFGPSVAALAFIFAIEVLRFPLNAAAATALAVCAVLLGATTALLLAPFIAAHAVAVLAVAHLLSEERDGPRAAELVEEGDLALRASMLADATAIVDRLAGRRWRGWLGVAGGALCTLAAGTAGFFPRPVALAATPLLAYATWRGLLEWDVARRVRRADPVVDDLLGLTRRDLHPNDIANPPGGVGGR